MPEDQSQPADHDQHNGDEDGTEVAPVVLGKQEKGKTFEE